MTIRIILSTFTIAGALAAQSGSPLTNNPRTLQSNGPQAPQNDTAFTQQHTSDQIRQQLALETILCNKALAKSSDRDVKAFAQHVIDQNQTLDALARGFAPDKSKSFPNQEFAGTRRAVEADAAHKAADNLKGNEFTSYFLKQMVDNAEYDQQLGHQAYAMMSFPGISPVGRKVWDIANQRLKDAQALASKHP